MCNVEANCVFRQGTWLSQLRRIAFATSEGSRVADCSCVRQLGSICALLSLHIQGCCPITERVTLSCLYACTVCIATAVHCPQVWSVTVFPEENNSRWRQSISASLKLRPVHHRRLRDKEDDTTGTHCDLGTATGIVNIPREQRNTIWLLLLDLRLFATRLACIIRQTQRS